ncbi:alpha/beta hydrolase family protein [Paenibacillus whitsoniae]|uniref:Alpha/beta hydrolase n=1 Tax=Paenibacillus whitsoniae TaxID=2496558 RepID=A0A430JH40_9BACL|nr:dienelactone hydrolase family protein [Paenibacillus whitsoniae]RTE10306.1 alpha/beta hydrolase [Paenibacillus whitsoniae]
MSNSVILSEKFKVTLANGLDLNGYIHTTADAQAKPVLILSHGFRGAKDWGFWPHVTSRFAERGFYTVSFDFSRIDAKQRNADEGLLAAASTLSSEIADLELVLSLLASVQLPLPEHADLSRISLLGHSRAGLSNLVVASERPEVRAVAVWNGGGRPPLSVKAREELTFQERAILDDFQAHEERYHAPSRLAKLHVPALFVQGTADAQRLLDAVNALKQLAPDQTFIEVPGADHTFGTVHPFQGTTVYLEEAFEATVAFLRRNNGEE